MRPGCEWPAHTTIRDTVSCRQMRTRYGVRLCALVESVSGFRCIQKRMNLYLSMYLISCRVAFRVHVWWSRHALLSPVPRVSFYLRMCFHTCRVFFFPLHARLCMRLGVVEADVTVSHCCFSSFSRSDNDHPQHNFWPALPFGMMPHHAKALGEPRFCLSAPFR